MAEPADDAGGQAVPALTAPVEAAPDMTTPVASPALKASRERLRAAERWANTGRAPLAALAALAAAALTWALHASGPVVAVAIAGVLALHQLGQVVAMKALGCEDAGLLLVPLPGVAIAGRVRRPGEWRAGLVSLAGPVPGLLLAAALLPFATAATPALLTVLLTLLIIDGLSLLPLGPLDGGRLMTIVLFSRHRHLELAATLGGIVALLLMPPVLPGSTPFLAIAVGGLMFQRLRATGLVDELRRSGHSFDGVTSELPDASLLALQAAAQRLPGVGTSTDGAMASTIARLHGAAAIRPARRGHSIALLLAWAGAVGLAWGCWHGVRHASAHWEELAWPGGDWRVEFPAKPSLTHATTRSAGRTQARGSPVSDLLLLAGVATIREYTAASLLGTFTLTVVTFEDAVGDDPASAEARLRSMVDEVERLTMYEAHDVAVVHGRRWPALQASFAMKLSEKDDVDALYVAEGKAVYVLTTVRADAESRDRFRESFRAPR